MRRALRVWKWVISSIPGTTGCHQKRARKSRVRSRLTAGGRWIRIFGPPSEGQRFSRLLFPNMRVRHRRLPKRSPPRPAAASSSCRSRSDERRTHSPTRRSSGPPDRRHHHPFALIPALCASPVSALSPASALSRFLGAGLHLSQPSHFRAQFRPWELLLAFDDQQGDGLRCAQPGAGPGNDINAGSPGSQKAPTRSPASPGAIRPGSTLIEEVATRRRLLPMKRGETRDVEGFFDHDRDSQRPGR